MTDQPTNDILHASSFLQGHNAESRIEAMKSARIVVTDSPTTLGEAVLKAIG